MLKPEDEALLEDLLSQVDKAPQAVLDELRNHKPLLLNPETQNQYELLHGLALANLWKHEQAEKLLARAYKNLKLAGIDFGIDRALDELASIYLIKGDTNKAMATWLLCLEHSIQFNALISQMWAHLGIGKTYFGLNDFINAKRHHLAAIEISFQLPECKLICEAYTCLAVDYIKLYEFKKAYSAIKIAQDYLHLSQFPSRSSCEFSIYLALCFAGQGQLSLALQHLDAAISDAQSSNYNWGLALAYLEKSKCLTLLRQNEQIRDCALKAEKIALEINSLAFACQASELLFQASKDMADYEAALKHHIDFTQRTIEKMERSHNQQLSSKILNQMQRAQERIQFENSQKENASLQNRLAKHQELINQLTDKAERDPLTAVFNRRALDARLEREIELASQLEQDFSILMIDIDHFKHINDEYSHQIGDAVLKQVVQLILQTCRQGEFVARYGGEEFTVLLPAADQVAACRVAERIRIAIEQFSWRQIHPKMRAITSSIGCATRRSNELASAIIARADACLYRAKHLGRNRVCCKDNADDCN